MLRRLIEDIDDLAALRDVDLADFLKQLAVRRNAPYGRDREQLKATIERCVAADEMSEFFLAAPARSRLFTSDAHDPLARTPIPLGEGAGDVRPEVAKRFYQIRNLIVIRSKAMTI